MASAAAASGPWRRKSQPQHQPLPRYRCFVQVDETTYGRLLASHLPAPLEPFGFWSETRYEEKRAYRATIAQGERGTYLVEWDRQKRPCLVVVLKSAQRSGMGSVDAATFEAMLGTLNTTCCQWFKDSAQAGLVLDDSLLVYQMSLGSWRRANCFTFKAQLPAALFLWALDRLSPPPPSEPGLTPDQHKLRLQFYDERRRHDMTWVLAVGPGLTNSAQRPVVRGSGSGSDSGRPASRGCNRSGGGADVGVQSSSYSGGGMSEVTDALAGASLSAGPTAPCLPPAGSRRWLRLPDDLQFGGVQAGFGVPPCTLMGSTRSPMVSLLRPLAEGAVPTPDDELWMASEVHRLMEAVENLIKARQWPLALATTGQEQAALGEGHEGTQAGKASEPGFRFEIVPCFD